jgi:hypothetical protein
MASLPATTAELRADLIEKIGDPVSVQLLDMMVRRSKAMGDGLFPPGRYTGTHAADDIAMAARMAELYTITPEMFDLIRHASESMPPQTLAREDLPSQSGFLYLPKAYHMLDVNGDPMPVRALLWHEETLGNPGDAAPGPGMPAIARGVVLYMFVDAAENAPPVRESGSGRNRRGWFLAHSPKMGLIHVMSFGFGNPGYTVDVDRMIAEGDDPETIARDARRFMHSIHDGIPIGEPAANGSVRVRTTSGKVLWVRPDPMLQFLSAYLHFMASELSAIDHPPLPRSLLKWLRRLEMPTGPVSVVRLRRRKPSGEGAGGWTLSYQYVRRGHWRRQPYGPRARPEYRWIWIAPALVGPEDGPLRVRDVVNVVAR